MGQGEITGLLPGIVAGLRNPGVRAAVVTPLQSIRLLLEGSESGDIARVRVAFVPLFILWPVGLAILAGAALLAVPAAVRSSSDSSA